VSNLDNDRIVQELVAREAIRDVVWRYCHAIDRGDEAVLKSVYWPEASEDHAGFVGPASDFIVDAMKKISENEQLQHLIGNTIIRITGSKANVESYFFCYQRLPVLEEGHPRWSGRVGDGRSDVMMGGRYLDQMERRGMEWRILHRTLAIDWWRLLEGSANWSTGLTGQPVLMGTRVPTDPSCRLFRGDKLEFRSESLKT